MELYEKEEYIHQQFPIRILDHFLEREEIYSPLHWHRGIEINLAVEGRILLKIGGRDYKIEKGDWCIVNSGELHSLIWVDRDDTYKGLTLLISKSFMDIWLGKNIYLTSTEDVEKQREIRNTIKRFAEIKKNPGKFYKAELMENLFCLIRLLGEYCATENIGSRGIKGINKIKSIINYMDEHYKENISLKSVASEFHYTPEHLSRLFKEHIGHNFYEYLQDVRLVNVMEQLKESPDAYLIDCALDNGFPNVKSFITTFKKRYHCTPSEWRKDRIGS